MNESNPYNKPSQKATDPELLASVTDDNNSRPTEVKTIEIHKSSIIPDPDQPRKHFTPEVLDERRRQLEAEGQLSPITVFPGQLVDGVMVYKLFDGECRWRCVMDSEVINFLRAEITTVDPADKFTILSQQLLHNDDGAEALSNIEKASAYLSLVEQAKAKGSDNPYGEVANVLGKHSSEVSRIISLVDLPASVIDFSLEHGIDDPKLLSGFKQVLKHSGESGVHDLQKLVVKAIHNRDNLRAVVRDFVNSVKTKSSSGIKKKSAKKLASVKARQLNVRDLSFSANVLLVVTPRETFKLKLSDDLVEKLKTLCC